ncbi:MAG: protein GumC, partial [Deltaproteobacteria bacterium]|nr:protein GumC [Deltaproteobacteria bacterium]
TRDYENVKALYASMLSRKLEAEIAVSMEKKQKGEQFRVIDPAKIPSQPIEPDMKKILAMALVLGLALGGGLAYLIEFLDTTYKSPEEVEKELKVPVLVGLPMLYTARDLKIRRIKKVAAPVFLLLAFILSATGIILAVKGVEPALDYLKNMLVKIS